MLPTCSAGLLLSTSHSHPSMPASEVLILILVQWEIICGATPILNLQPYDAFFNCVMLGEKIKREHFSAHSCNLEAGGGSGLEMGVPVSRGRRACGRGLDGQAVWVAKAGEERAGLCGGFWNFTR